MPRARSRTATLRLASASTIGEAQTVLERFLPRFNARFAVAARQPEVAYRLLDPALDLGAILAFRHTRTVARDNTVKYRWRTLQLLLGMTTRSGPTVMISSGSAKLTGVWGGGGSPLRQRNEPFHAAPRAVRGSPRGGP